MMIDKQFFKITSRYIYLDTNIVCTVYRSVRTCDGLSNSSRVLYYDDGAYFGCSHATCDKI